MKNVLLYGLSDYEADRIQQIFETHGVAAYIVGDDVLDRKVGELFDISEDFDGRHVEFDRAFMIVEHIKGEEFRVLLKELAESDAAFHGAILFATEKNRTYSLRQLFHMCDKELEYSLKRIRLQQLIESCNGVNITDLPPSEKAEFKRSLREAILTVKSKKEDLVKLNRVIEDLEKASKGLTKLYN